MSSQRRPLARHAGKFSPWFHLLRMNVKRWRDKKPEGCAKLAHVKSYNTVVLQKEELWIFIFWHTSLIFQTSNGSSLLLLEIISVFVVPNQNPFHAFFLSTGCNTENIYTRLSNFSRFIPRQIHTTSQEFALSPRRPSWHSRIRCSPVPAHLRSLNVWVCCRSRQRGNVMLASPPRPGLALPFSETRKVAYFILWTWEVKSRLLKEWESTQCTIINMPCYFGKKRCKYTFFSFSFFFLLL